VTWLKQAACEAWRSGKASFDRDIHFGEGAVCGGRGGEDTQRGRIRIKKTDWVSPWGRCSTAEKRGESRRKYIGKKLVTVQHAGGWDRSEMKEEGQTEWSKWGRRWKRKVGAAGSNEDALEFFFRKMRSEGDRLKKKGWSNGVAMPQTITASRRDGKIYVKEKGVEKWGALVWDGRKARRGKKNWGGEVLLLGTAMSGMFKKQITGSQTSAKVRGKRVTQCGIRSSRPKNLKARRKETPGVCGLLGLKDITRNKGGTEADYNELWSQTDQDDRSCGEKIRPWKPLFVDWGGLNQGKITDVYLRWRSRTGVG